MFLIMGLQMLIKTPITAAWAICKISGQEWQWSLATAVSVPIVVSRNRLPEPALIQVLLFIINGQTSPGQVTM